MPALWNHQCGEQPHGHSKWQVSIPPFTMSNTCHYSCPFTLRPHGASWCSFAGYLLSNQEARWKAICWWANNFKTCKQEEDRVDTQIQIAEKPGPGYLMIVFLPRLSNCPTLPRSGFLPAFKVDWITRCTYLPTTAALGPLPSGRNSHLRQGDRGLFYGAKWDVSQKQNMAEFYP